MNNMASKKKNIFSVLIILVLVLFCLAVFAACLGKYKVTAGDSLGIVLRAIAFQEQIADPMTVNVVLNLRLPRIIVSIFVGAALSISGAAYQGVFQNPLVSPDFLGVSSGACIGAAIAILFGFSSMAISGFAFVGGLLAVLLTAALPMLVRNKSNIMLVLSGIIISSLMSSILGFIKYTADPDTQLASITYWTMGDFSYVSASDLIHMLLILLPPMIILLLMSWWVDVLSMGSNEARTLGANVRLLRAIVIICSTLLTAGSICLAGTIGWVGLIVPHFSRMLVGSSNRRVLPVSCLIGGIFMLLVDTMTRLIGASEMPVSIMTGIIGAPFFCWLLFKRKNKVM